MSAHKCIMINHLYTTVSVPDRLYKKIAIQLERLVLIGALYLY